MSNIYYLKHDRYFQKQICLPKNEYWSDCRYERRYMAAKYKLSVNVINN